MEWTKVATQAELDAAIDKRQMNIKITAAVLLECRVPDGWTLILNAVSGSCMRLLSGNVVARGSSHVEARESSHVVARGSSHVEAWGSSHVEAWESSRVDAWESSHVVARGSSHVEARESSHVVARESSHVVARGSSHVEAWESSRVDAWESSHVEARESSHVVARESSHVVARGSSHVEARGSSHVVARGSSHVVARGSSHVEAWGAVSLSLFGTYLQANASAGVSVHLHNGAKCDGGVQIVVNKFKTPQEWCDWYGVQVVDGYAIVFKGVRGDFTSPKGWMYEPGTETIADDWDGGDVECGKGLHFSPCASMTKEFIDNPKHFVACLIPLTEMAVHPNGNYPHKCKAKRCWNLYECDSFGKQIGERFEPTAPIVAKPKRKAAAKRNTKNK